MAKESHLPVIGTAPQPGGKVGAEKSELEVSHAILLLQIGRSYLLTAKGMLVGLNGVTSQVISD